MPIQILLLIVLCGWIAWAWCCQLMRTNPRGSHDVFTGLAWWSLRLYARYIHHLRVQGMTNIPALLTSLDKPIDPPAVGSLIVISNHTAGIDPLLIQTACTFEIRWMMARGMMHPDLHWLWDWAGMIPVEQNGRDLSSLREALRTLKTGGVLGIFPEGGLARPPQTVMQFQPGVGLIIAKSKARVLPVCVSGTPTCDSAITSLFRTSHSTIRFLPIRSYTQADWTPESITQDLHMCLSAELGWPSSGPRVLAPA